MKPKYLLNPKSGAVFPATDLLLQKATGLVACEQDGTPLSSYDVNSDDDIIESPFLLNPVTGAVLPFSLLLARQEGLIPCDDYDHANRILKNLGRDELITELADASEAAIQPEAESPGLHGRDTEASAEEEVGETEAAGDAGQSEAGEEEGTNIEDLVPVGVADEIKDFTKKQIVAYCMENFGEKLDARLNRTMLLEQATMLINSRSAVSEDEIEKISMA
jgi:hypothetical protein